MTRDAILVEHRALGSNLPLRRRDKQARNSTQNRNPVHRFLFNGGPARKLSLGLAGVKLDNPRRRHIASWAMQPTRRELLTGLAAFGASTLLSRAQTPAVAPRIIDIHRHFISPAFLKVLNAKTGHKVDGFTNFFPLGPWKDYSPARDIETMDKQGLATAYVSTTSPGTWFGNRDETRGLAREMNEFGAKMASDYKGRFGLFALLPFPSVDDCLREIEYAFDTLKADGVGLLTSYGTRYLGDPAF